MAIRYNEYLTKAEAEERLRYAHEDAKFCPDCLSQLGELEGADESLVLMCRNEMCLNEEEYPIKEK